jgi:peroxiredoxin Q/BCP
MSKVMKKTAKKTVKKVAVKKTVTSVKKVTKKATVKKITPKKVGVKIKKTSEVVSTKLQIGDVAPDFSLMDQNGKEVSLHEFKGKNVVVYFYPKAMTPGCTVQACEIRNAEKKLEDADIVVLGISADSVSLLKKFEEKEKLNFSLLSDPDKNVIKAYGSWGPKKFMGREYDGILRQSFFVNKLGKIVHIMHKVETKTHHQDILNFFNNLK